MKRERVAIISGGTHGIGLAIVTRFLSEGWSVMTCSCNETDVASVLEPLMLRFPTGRLEFREADMGRTDQIDAFVDATVGCLGPPDAVVNNAAFVRFLPTYEATPEDIERTLRVNVLGYWRLAQRSYALMAQRNGGAIVNIGSTHPLQTGRASFPYNISKGAVSAMTKAMAVDFGPANVRVNTVLPGIVYTRLTERWMAGMEDKEAKLNAICSAHPLGRLPQADEVAAAVYFLACDASSGITGAELIVDAGRQAMRV